MSGVPIFANGAQTAAIQYLFNQVASNNSPLDKAKRKLAAREAQRPKQVGSLIQAGFGVLAIAGCVIAEPCGAGLLLAAIGGGIATVTGLNSFNESVNNYNVLTSSLEAAGVSENFAKLLVSGADISTLLINPSSKAAGSLMNFGSGSFSASKFDNYMDVIHVGNTTMQNQAPK